MFNLTGGVLVENVELTFTSNNLVISLANHFSNFITVKTCAVNYIFGFNLAFGGYNALNFAIFGFNVGNLCVKNKLNTVFSSIFSQSLNENERIDNTFSGNV